MNPVTVVSGVVVFIGLASYGVFALALRRLMSLARAWDAGDVVVLAVLIIFGSFCVFLGWTLFRYRGEGASPARVPETVAPRRVSLSHGFAAAGVLLLMLSVLVPANWYPVLLLFAGLALLALSHALTPCEERLAMLRRVRASVRQL